MTDVPTLFWFAAGLLAGVAHATMLWQATHRLTTSAPVTGMLRLVAVATVLIVAAMYGALFAVAGGWAVGCVVLGAWCVMSRTSTPVPSPRSHSRD